MAVKCKNCQDARWVCEDHQDYPWAGMTGGKECCGGAGAPCPKCNPCDRDNPPAQPDGFQTICTVEDGLVSLPFAQEISQGPKKVH